MRTTLPTNAIGKTPGPATATHSSTWARQRPCGSRHITLFSFPLRVHLRWEKDTCAMSGAVKAHGLNGALVEPDWAPMTVEEVRALLVQFPECGEPIAILSTSPRPFSAASVVATQTVRVFIKRQHRSVRDREGL